MPAYSDEKQRALSVFDEGLRGRKPATSSVHLLLAGKWSRKKGPNPKKYPLSCLFFTSCAMPPIPLWYPGEFSLKTIALLCFFFSQTYKQPHPLHRHIFNSVITPQGDETAVQPPAGAASSVKSFLWDSTGVGGVRLSSPTAAGRDGGRELWLAAVRRGRQSRRLPSRSLFHWVFN